jgi:hypothetical protein
MEDSKAGASRLPSRFHRPAMPHNVVVFFGLSETGQAQEGLPVTDIVPLGANYQENTK